MTCIKIDRLTHLVRPSAIDSDNKSNATGFMLVLRVVKSLSPWCLPRLQFMINAFIRMDIIIRRCHPTNEAEAFDVFFRWCSYAVSYSVYVWLFSLLKPLDFVGLFCKAFVWFWICSKDETNFIIFVKLQKLYVFRRKQTIFAVKLLRKVLISYALESWTRCHKGTNVFNIPHVLVQSHLKHQKKRQQCATEMSRFRKCKSVQFVLRR